MKTGWFFFFISVLVLHAPESWAQKTQKQKTVSLESFEEITAAVWQSSLEKEKLRLEFTDSGGHSPDFDKTYFVASNEIATEVWEKILSCNRRNPVMARAAYLSGRLCDEPGAAVQIRTKISELRNGLSKVSRTSKIFYPFYDLSLFTKGIEAANSGSTEPPSLPWIHPFFAQIVFEVLASSPLFDVKPGAKLEQEYLDQLYFLLIILTQLEERPCAAWGLFPVAARSLIGATDAYLDETSAALTEEWATRLAVISRQVEVVYFQTCPLLHLSLTPEIEKYAPKETVQMLKESGKVTSRYGLYGLRWVDYRNAYLAISGPQGGGPR